MRQKQISFSDKLASVLPLNLHNEEVDDESPSFKRNVTSCIEFGKEEPRIENLQMLPKNIFLPLF
jgi:hypothetical protein